MYINIMVKKASLSPSANMYIQIGTTEISITSCCLAYQFLSLPQHGPTATILSKTKAYHQGLRETATEDLGSN